MGPRSSGSSRGSLIGSVACLRAAVAEGCLAAVAVAMPASWKDVQVEKMLVITGGFADKPYTAQTKEVFLGGKQVDFVRLNKNDHWMLKGAGGRGCQKGGLRRTTAMQLLRDALQSCSEEKGEVVQAAVAAEGDPMGALEVIEAAPVSSEDAKRKKTTKAAPKDLAKELKVPERLGSPQLRTVTVMKTGTDSLWLLAEDIPWLLRYLADEVESGGVPPIDDPDGEEVQGGSLEDVEATETPQKPKQARTALTQIRWDFAGAWTATMRSGPKKGTTITCKVENMTAEKWSVAAAEHEYGTTFEKATEAQKREATRHFLEIYVRNAS